MRVASLRHLPPLRPPPPLRPSPPLCPSPSLRHSLLSAKQSFPTQTSPTTQTPMEQLFACTSPQPQLFQYLHQKEIEWKDLLDIREFTHFDVFIIQPLNQALHLTLDASAIWKELEYMRTNQPSRATDNRMVSMNSDTKAAQVDHEKPEYTPIRKQKSSLSKCNAFLCEIEGKSGPPENCWEVKPNTQQLARLFQVGTGNMNFYTGTKTLMFQGTDAQQIRQCFVDWRRERV